MNKKNNISVVITCHKEGTLLLDAVNSVFSQSVAPLEIILVRDASDDTETQRVCCTLAEDSRIRLTELEKNGGPSVARNVGFLQAKGEILVPLDADDLLPPQALEHIQSAFLRFPKASFIYGTYIRQDSENCSQRIVAEEMSLQSMLKARRFSISSNWRLIGTAPLKKSLWEKVGHSDPSLDASDLHDLEFWLRAMALPCQHFAISEDIYIWRKYLGRNSSRVTPLSWYRVAEKHFDVYRSLGLEYRACELLLLGSKWLGDGEKISFYARKLMHCISRGQYQASSFIVLVIPACLFKLLARKAGHRR